ncbi:hypothetical protein AB0M43_12780 [Longispora sp. NPDC051575]|uniref:hypothetical protein n=1 Tax=Longispora sp. NPDC051575 TaxID=3154943 RepID=UPI00341DC8EC
MHSLPLSDPDRPHARIRWLDLPGDDERPVRVFVPGAGVGDGAVDYVESALHPALSGHRTLLVDLPPPDRAGPGTDPRADPRAASRTDPTPAPSIPGAPPTDIDPTPPSAGPSPTPTATPTTRTPTGADALAALLDHLALTAVEIIAHGSATPAAIVLAELRPELVGRLIAAAPDLTDHGDTFAALKCPRAFVVGGRNRPAPEEDLVRAAGVPIVEVLDAGRDLVGDNPAGYAESIAAALLVAR